MGNARMETYNEESENFDMNSVLEEGGKRYNFLYFEFEHGE